MHRKPLLGLLDRYSLRYPEEEETLSRFVDFVERCPNCFDRELEEGHITGSAWLVDRSGESVLLTHHRKLNIWVQLGGHADGESEIAKVALKEANEESGLSALTVLHQDIFDIDIHTIPARKQDPEHLHYDVRFVVKHEGDGDYTVSEESHDLAWIAIAELDAVTGEESMLRMRNKWLSEQKQ